MKKWLLLIGILLLPTLCLAGGEQPVRGTLTATITQATVTLTSAAHPLLNYSSVATITGTTLSNYALLPPQSGKTLNIYGIRIYNRTSATTAGTVDFYWDVGATSLCYPSSGGQWVGLVDDMHRTSLNNGLYVTSTISAVGIIVWYEFK